MNNTPSERFAKALDYLKETRAIRAFKDILEGSEYQPSTISEIRAGRQEPNDWILQTLQEKYRISKDWIVRDAGEMVLLKPDKQNWEDTSSDAFTGDFVQDRNKNRAFNQMEFDNIVNRHYARFDALENTLTKEQKFAYRHLYNNVAPEKMWVYVLSKLDK